MRVISWRERRGEPGTSETDEGGSSDRSRKVCSLGSLLCTVTWHRLALLTASFRGQGFFLKPVLRNKSPGAEEVTAEPFTSGGNAVWASVVWFRATSRPAVSALNKTHWPFQPLVTSYLLSTCTKLELVVSGTKSCHILLQKQLGDLLFFILIMLRFSVKK